MKIAITGGSGFIGSRLTQALKAQGHEIVNVDIVDPVAPKDILDLATLTAAFAGCNAIYHLAAAHRDDIFPRTIYYEVNGEGTGNVVKAAEANNIQKIIFTSSVAVYGLDAQTPDEQTRPDPFNDYGKSKLDAEDILRAWAEKEPSRCLTIVRPVVVFGEGNRGNVHTLITQIDRGRFVMVGNGKNKKSMAYVGNVADFLTFCLTKSEGMHLYNYADKPDFSMQDLTDVIYQALNKSKPAFHLPYAVGMTAGCGLDVVARLTGKTFPISAVRVKKFCADTTVSSDHMRASGFMPPYTLSDGITRMIESDFRGPETESKKDKAA